MTTDSNFRAVTGNSEKEPIQTTKEDYFYEYVLNADTGASTDIADLDLNFDKVGI